jgi:hypothetical protein
MKRRRPPAAKAARAHFTAERIPRIERGGFAASVTILGKGVQINIHLSTKNSPRSAYFACRLIGHRFVVHYESEHTEHLPPYLGRQFRTRAELHALMSEMLAAYIMLHS